MNKVQDFINEWNGKTIDYDWVYWNQCKDFTNQYTKEVFDYESPKGNAYEVYSKDWGDRCEKFLNTPDFLPKQWDIIIWNIWEYGHIWVVVNATLSNMTIIDQNTGNGNWDGLGNNKIRVHIYNYNNVHWFIRIKDKPMNKFWPDITIKWLTFPSSVYWIPVRLARTNSKTLMGKANIKDYAPNCTKDEILIFENSFTKWEDYLYKILTHETFHFYQHLVFSDEQNKYLEDLYKFIPDKVSTYASKLHWENWAETYSYWEVYIKHNKELPENKVWNDAIVFIYDACVKFAKSREDKLIALIQDRK